MTKAQPVKKKKTLKEAIKEKEAKKEEERKMKAELKKQMEEVNNFFTITHLISKINDNIIFQNKSLLLERKHWTPNYTMKLLNFEIIPKSVCLNKSW